MDLHIFISPIGKPILRLRSVLRENNQRFTQEQRPAPWYILQSGF